MSCLGWFKRRRSRSGGSSTSTSGKRGASASAPVSVSGPATTMTTTTMASAVSTSRSDDSGAVRPVSKSAGSSSQASQRSISSLYEERGHGQLRVFDYEELQGATAEFSRAQKLGEGGFGSVYKGFIRAADGKGDRVPVAVKKLNQRSMQVRPYVCSASP